MQDRAIAHTAKLTLGMLKEKMVVNGLICFLMCTFWFLNKVILCHFIPFCLLVESYGSREGPQRNNI